GWITKSFGNLVGVPTKTLTRIEEGRSGGVDHEPSDVARVANVSVLVESSWTHRTSWTRCGRNPSERNAY
ncbi:MAG: hypothetical protein VXY35_00795, partial [Candidatus Thermoplasmatota archaeon]|nr:hypothetical protein [Candidatus Thermoplasmatota archaeon]